MSQGFHTREQNQIKHSGKHSLLPLDTDASSATPLGVIHPNLPPSSQKRHPVKQQVKKTRIANAPDINLIETTAHQELNSKFLPGSIPDFLTSIAMCLDYEKELKQSISHLKHSFINLRKEYERDKRIYNVKIAKTESISQVDPTFKDKLYSKIAENDSLRKKNSDITQLLQRLDNQIEIQCQYDAHINFIKTIENGANSLESTPNTNETPPKNKTLKRSPAPMESSQEQESDLPKTLLLHEVLNTLTDEQLQDNAYIKCVEEFTRVSNNIQMLEQNLKQWKSSIEWIKNTRNDLKIRVSELKNHAYFRCKNLKEYQTRQVLQRIKQLDNNLSMLKVANKKLQKELQTKVKLLERN